MSLSMSLGESSKSRLYAQHLTTDLLPSLEATRQAIQQTEHDISEYRDLAERLRGLEQTGHAPQTTLTELGGGCYVDAQIPDTSRVTLDIGLELHLEMGAGEAIEYAEKRAGVLEKRISALKVREENIIWQIEQFRGAIAEADAGPKTAQAGVVERAA
ncbi:hypothetical protein EHS25_003819 [Saitozyma podzolica]|uniref:Subunit of tubulin prefoldin n=1 Tax=Saitozyma podzolica TaxID=1890683 RepID=A0A427Y3M0_9TREE|nr:hypothetical protein EHS25_003819 [Saitozyma podzolica]